jgi:ATP-dependent Clp protease ATP-binding subunit ClpA
VFERFTEKAIKVIMLAQEEARRMGHNFVGTEQILLGLCGEGTGIAARVLRAHNIKLKDLRVTVLGIIGKGSGNVSVQIPFTPRAKKLLEAGWNIARDLEHNYIGTEHLLLGLLEVEGAVAKQVLSKHNVDLEKIRIDVIDFVQTAQKKQSLASANPAHATVQDQSERLVESSVPIKSQALVRSAKGPVEKSNVADLFSQLTIIVMQLAQQEARRVGSMKLELQHLLLGILLEGSSEAARLLAAKGIKLDDLRLVAFPEEVELSTDSVVLDFELSKQVFAAVEMASIVARKYGGTLVTPEHLLFALLSYEESRAVKGLQKLGVNIELFVDELRTLMQALVPHKQFAESNSVTESNVAEPYNKQDLPFTVDDAGTGAPVNLSNRSIQVVMEAMKGAHALGHNFVSTEFLLLGLFSSAGGGAKHALLAHGASAEMVRLVIERLLGVGPGSTDLPVPSTANSRETFQLAVEQSRRLSSGVVEPEHLLLALLQITDSNAYRILDNLNVNLAEVNEQLLQSITPLSPPTPNKSKFIGPISKVSANSQTQSTGGEAQIEQALVLTDMVEHSIILATEEAHRLGHVEVDTDHVLLGLIREPDGLASLALHVWDVKTKELRQESENMPGREKADSPCESRCGSKVNELILAARMLAQEARQKHVGTGHVLLALVADEDSAGLKVLRNLSIDVDRLKKTLINANAAPQGGSSFSALVPLAKQKGFERFSDEALKALMFAKEESSRLGHCQIDSQFLLLGICDERLNKGAERLRKIGISLDDLRFEVEHITGHGDGDCGSEIVFCERSLQILRWSFETVIASGIEVIRPEHLFVALISEESGPAYELLQQFNVSVERMQLDSILNLRLEAREFRVESSREKVKSLIDFRHSSILELLSDKAIDVILRAQQEALALSHNRILPCHLLLALWGERIGIAVKAAAIAGLSVERLRSSIRSLGDAELQDQPPIRFSIQAENALVAARVTSELCKSRSIEPDHLLIGVFKGDSCSNLFDRNFGYYDYKQLALMLLQSNYPTLFAPKHTVQTVSSQPAFFKLTDCDIDRVLERAADGTEKLAMRIFSSSAQNAIRLAVIEARRLGRAQVGTDHLLVGILSGEDSVAATAMTAIGVTRGSLVTAIEREYGRGSCLETRELPFSKNAILALEEAYKTSKSFGLSEIGIDQLIIGILNIQKVVDRGSFSREDCAGVTILRSLSVDIGYLRQLIFDRMSAPRTEDRVEARPGIETGSRKEDQVLPLSKRFTYSDAAIKRFDNFAADSLKAILIAHEEAREKRLSLVGTEQILLALILEPEGKAGVILQSLGVTAQRVRAEIERFVQAGSGVSHGGEPYTSEAIGVFHLARRGAHFIEGKVGTEHLLLGIVTNPRYFASIILQRAGVDVAKLQEIMAEEQAAISALREAAAQTNQTIEKLCESLPVVDYQAAIAVPGVRLDTSQETLDAEHTRESIQGALQGMISDQSLGLPKGDWIALKERFTANLHTVIDGAKADSCNRNNGIVDAPQLLFALLNLPTNSCAYHLTTLNIDRFALRNRLDRLLQGTRPSSSSAFVGFSALADKLLLRAFQLSIFEGGGWVQTKHLLLALIESNDEKFFPFLVAMQLRSDEVVGGSTLMPPMLAELTLASRLLVNGLSQASFKVTATAERAMKFAASEAKQMGHNFVGTEQVMLGLIAAGDGVAGQVLLTYGLSLTDVRRSVRAIIGLGSGNVADEIPFTPRTQRMLDLSLCEAQRLQHDEIGTGHILLGLLREGHGVAARVLTEMGLSLDKLIEVTEGKLLEDAAKKSSSISVNDDATSDQAYEQ